MAEFDYEVVDGRKIRVRPQEVVSEIDENGYFVRQPNHFTEGFGEGKNPVEKGRYHLVWAKLCHWSNRASIVRELLGLEDAISVNMVDHAKHEKNLGWEFVYDKDHIDPVLGIQFLSEAYYKADDDYTGRTTVQALIDTKTGKVVNNDYTWLTNYFEVDFKPFHKKGAPDLYPEELRKDIDEMNDWLFDNINNGVYKATFLGLEDAVKVEIVDWTDREENLGWEFVNSPDHINPETGAQFLSELYYNADEEYTGRTTVPAFVDYKTKKVVNNDYHWLTNHLETAFRPFHKKGAPDLYPEELRPEIDKLNKWLFENVNNAVYRAQFAESLQAFADGYETFFAGLDAMEERLADKRFLFGDYVTDSDIRLYTTIARLDVSYSRNIGPCKHRLVDYPNLWGYARDTSVFLQHVADGSQDFTIIDLAMYNSYMEEFNYDVQKNDIPEDEAKMIAENSYAYYIFPQDQKDLREQVDKALKELKEDGTLTEISKKWYGQDTAPEDDKFEKTIN